MPPNFEISAPVVLVDGVRAAALDIRRPSRTAIALAAATATTDRCTTSQRAAIAQIVELIEIKRAGLTFAGWQPRTAALVIGPSGAGKSNVNSLVARKAGLSLWTVTTGSWTPRGSQIAVSACNRLHAHLVEQGPALIVIDETDKIRSHGDNSNYYSSVFDEILAVLDGRIGTWGWSPPALDALAKSHFVFCGAFQDLYRRKLGDEVMFAEEVEALTLSADDIFNAGWLPAELLNRVAAILNRESVQSSIRRQFGFPPDGRKVPPAEQGIAEMMTNLYRHFDAPLTNETLFAWHAMLTNGRRDLHDIGRYRTGTNPMQVISGPIDHPKVHFEAPPSEAMGQEMDRFLDWFRSTAPGGKSPLPALTRAGIAHLYFVSVHPFEDGNGRIGRAVAEKSLAESLGHPTLIALSQTIHSRRKNYYDLLEQNNQTNEITDWLLYFARTVLDAQRYSQKLIDRLIDKAKFFDRFRGQLNERQEKALVRMFREEPDGFKGGMSADKYIRITGASRATATRDLQDLVEKEALTRTGALKGTRYHLPLEQG